MKQADLEIWARRWEEAEKHPWPFVKYFFVTLDQHEKDLTIKLTKPFPARAVFRIVTRAWMQCPILFIEKFRQGQFTWLFSGLNLWENMMIPGTTTFFQSKKQDDANDILERSRHVYSFIYDLGQSSLFEVPKIKMTGDKLGNKERIQFPDKKSEIRSIPQGGDVVRMHTLSRLFADESEFQPEFEDAFRAALPTIAGGGKLNSISTVNGKGFVWRKINGIDDYTHKRLGEHQLDSKRCKTRIFKPPKHLSEEQQAYWIDRELCNLPQAEFDEMPFEELVAQCPGVRYWRTTENHDALLIDHWADPDKSEATTKGKSWVAFWSRAMGRSMWEQEMLRNRDRFKGRPVVLNWKRSRFVREFPYDERAMMHGSSDFGTDLCGTLFAQVKTFPEFSARQLRVIWEIILENSNTPELARKMIEVFQGYFRRSWEENLVSLYCDPAGHQARETTSDRSMDTSIKIFQAYNLYPSAQKFGKVDTTQTIEAVFDAVLPNGEPAILIHPRCEYLIECVAGGLHYPDKGRDGYYANNRYTHGGDMLRYLLGNVLDEYDVGVRNRPYIPKIKYIRRQYTGEIVGRRRSTRVNPRRGQHAVRVR